jgi:hypothetical protein
VFAGTVLIGAGAIVSLRGDAAATIRTIEFAGVTASAGVAGPPK